MISHKHKCIFIHIPKCAGTSIERVLGHHDKYTGKGMQDHRTLRMHCPYFEFINLFKRGNLKHSLKHLKRNFFKRNTRNPNNNLGLTKQQYLEYYKFTVVRNPYSRAFSWYLNVLRNQYKKEYQNYVSESSFEKFLKKNAGKRHLSTQMEFIVNYDGFIEMDYIMRFENLQYEFDEIRKILNLTKDLPHKLRSQNFDYHKFYTKKSIDIIKSVYSEELKYFNYKY